VAYSNLIVCELFAGVGGFRLGLSKSGWSVIWANQWEPIRRHQWAFDCYKRHFETPGTICVNEDISRIEARYIPPITLLVGGFPCQDYSVAKINAHGIEGKKGALWWCIEHILRENIERGTPIPYILLENVDRLVKSPTKQRGRDFGIILACLNKMGYATEWRVINAADYGFPQKRRRTFIFATRVGKVVKALYDEYDGKDVLLSKGFFAPAFRVELGDNGVAETKLPDDLQVVSDAFKFDFQNAGYMNKGHIFTAKVVPKYHGKKMTLGDMLVPDAAEEYYVDQALVGDPNEPPKVFRKTWRYCKGPKAEYRKDSNGYEYYYTEGGIPFPDMLDQPSRTMLTSDGNKRPNRLTHLVLDPRTNRYRVLTPVETERLNGFDDDWTLGMPLKWRYFCMGNALVVGLIEIMGRRLLELQSVGPSPEVKTLDMF
jgi:DNA (cytosine-5)-methyltransferase 1